MAVVAVRPGQAKPGQAKPSVVCRSLWCCVAKNAGKPRAVAHRVDVGCGQVDEWTRPSGFDDGRAVDRWMVWIVWMPKYTRRSATALLWLHSVGPSMAGQSRNKGARARARPLLQSIWMSLIAGNVSGCLLCTSLGGPHQTVGTWAGRLTSGQEVSRAKCRATVRTLRSGGLLTSPRHALPYEEETVWAGQRQEGESGGSNPALGGRDDCSFPKATGRHPHRRYRDLDGTWLVHAMAVRLRVTSCSSMVSRHQ